MKILVQEQEISIVKNEAGFNSFILFPTKWVLEYT